MTGPTASERLREVEHVAVPPDVALPTDQAASTATGEVSNSIRLVVFSMLALPQLLIGVWGVLAPRNWYDTFPGVGPNLVAAEPPFNAHLASDTGAGFLATGVALAVAALWGRWSTVHLAVVTYLSFAVPHLVYHAVHPAPGLTGPQDVVNVVLLSVGPLVAVAVAAAGIGGRPRQPPR